MPASKTAAAGGSHVADSARELAAALTAAEVLVMRPDETAAAMVTGSSAAGSAPPWNAAAAAVVLDIHEGIRRLEASLHTDIHGDPGTRRGCSWANTLRAITSVTSLAEGIPAKHAREVARILGRWTSAAERLPAIDEAEQWTVLRSSSGRVPPLCPYCKTPSLRYAARARIVACFKPACHDSDGNRPVGRLDMSVVNGDPILAWRDGAVQHQD